MVSTAVATEEPVEPEPWPVVLVMELSCWLRTAERRRLRGGECWWMCWRRVDREPPAAALVAVPENAAAEPPMVWVPLILPAVET